MALSNSYTEAYGKIGEFFSQIRDGQAPPQFTQQFLIDLGFKSNKHRAYIQILKSLGFLSPEGRPTQRYKDYRDHSKSRLIMGDAIKEAYSDIFLIKENPSSADHSTVEGKFKSFHNCSDNVAQNMRRTFFALLELADISTNNSYSSDTDFSKSQLPDSKPESHSEKTILQNNIQTPGLHYNIQVHLPATKDIEVYNAIFKSLKEHLY